MVDMFQLRDSLKRLFVLALSAMFVLGVGPLAVSRSCCANAPAANVQVHKCDKPCCQAPSQVPTCCEKRAAAQQPDGPLAVRPACDCHTISADRATTTMDLERIPVGTQPGFLQAFATGARISMRAAVVNQPEPSMILGRDGGGPDPSLPAGCAVVALRRLLSRGAAGMLAVLGIARL